MLKLSLERKSISTNEIESLTPIAKVGSLNRASIRIEKRGRFLYIDIRILF